MGAVSTTSTNYCGVQGSEFNVIAGYGTDILGSINDSVLSNISVESRGIAPNRQYVIQWKNCTHYTPNTIIDHWNFQIILNETSNKVQVGKLTDDSFHYFIKWCLGKKIKIKLHKI
jgi:hypothetical protein